MFIKVYHPELDRTVEVDDRAFDMVWKDKGWQRVEEAEPPLVDGFEVDPEYDDFDIESISDNPDD